MVIAEVRLFSPQKRTYYISIPVGTNYLIDAVYCGDKLDSGVIFLKGNGKTLVNMDIDCDGAQNGPADDGRCGNSGDTQSITSFQSTIKSYGAGINDVDAYIHPYVVFGNEGSKPGWATFNPEQYGIEPLSLMAVVCGNQLVSRYSCQKIFLLVMRN